MKIIILLFSIFLGFVQSSAAKECNPQTPTNFILKKGKFHKKGPAAKFDPCHKSISLKNLKKKKKMPLVMLIHGAGGKSDVTQVSSFLRSKGYATFEFDAFEMNGIKNYKVNLVKYSNSTRQEMIYPISRGGLKWILKQEGVDLSRVYIYGISNGATVAANLAAGSEAEKIKAVVSEGPTHAGMGMPDEVVTKLHLVFGKLDNFGARSEDGWRWIYRTPCEMNVSLNKAPKGNTINCNKKVSSGDGLVENHITWYEKQKKKNNNTEIHFYEDAAHGIFHPKGLKKGFRTHKKLGFKVYINTGAKPAVLKKYKKDLLTYFN